MVLEQNTEGVRWTPSKMITGLGKEISNPESVYYCAQKNHIPVLIPALTDGSLGNMVFFHYYTDPSLILDIVEDLRLISTQAVFPQHTQMTILGGSVVKHHIANTSLMRNGADYAACVNMAQEFDDSDSGARLDEAVSWGKIWVDAQPVLTIVYANASLVFPLLVAETFAQKRQMPSPLRRMRTEWLSPQGSLPSPRFISLYIQSFPHSLVSIISRINGLSDPWGKKKW